MKLLLLITCLTYFYFSTTAQQTSFLVSGTVSDSLSAKGVELATVVLNQQPGSEVINGGTADAEGKFVLQNVKAGKYEMLISFVGYNTKKIPVEVNADVNLGIIKLSASAQMLDAAVVVAERSLITKSAEKTVFNVAQSPTNQTGTAEDVLRNMPGVSVDQKGNVSIVGKQGVKILVDGRPNALAQSDLPSFLKSIPASSIESIELITNPSARYDAEGNAGIINIKLKKGKADGLNGSVSAGYGILDRYNGNLAINYRKNKINVFATYSVNEAKNGNHWIENRKINVNDTASYYKLNSVGVTHNLNNNLKAGIDYLINDKNTLTYTLGGNYSKSRWVSNADAESLDAQQTELAKYASVDDERGSNFSVTNDILYTKKFDSTDRELDIDINHTYVSGSRGATLNSLAYDTTGAYMAGNSLFRRTSSANNIHNAIFQLDYIHPLKKLKGYKIETGAKNETTINNNAFNAYNTVSNVETSDTLLSNNFNYTENISAAYLIMSGAYKKMLSYSAGVRGEYTYIHSNNNSVNKSYPSFFPSASINVAINDTQTFSVSYSRRIERPQFRQINNTISYIDQYTTWQGNSFLQPAFSNIITANYTITLKKYMFSFDAGGTFQNGMFIESSYVDSLRIGRGGVTNGGNTKAFNLGFYCKLQITKWWEFQANQNYSYTVYGFKPGVNLSNIAGSSYNIWASTNFKFWKNMVFEVNGWFNTKAVNPQGVGLPVGVLNASLKKSFLKDHLTVSLAAINILNTMKWRWITYNTGLTANGSWANLNRTLMITLTYKFGSNSNAAPHKAHGENDRLGGDGGGRQ